MDPHYSILLGDENAKCNNRKKGLKPVIIIAIVVPVIIISILVIVLSILAYPRFLFIYFYYFCNCLFYLLIVV